MYQHSAFHLAMTLLLGAGLFAVFIVCIAYLRRGDIAFVRRRLLMFIGIALLFADALLTNSRIDHTVAADRVRFLACGLTIIGGFQMTQQQAIGKALEKKERERQQRQANRLTP